MKSNSRIFITGHRGLVGSAIKRRCEALGYRNVIALARSELDLRNQAAVDAFFASERPEYVFQAGRCRRRHSREQHAPAEFIRDNLQIATKRDRRGLAQRRAEAAVSRFELHLSETRAAGRCARNTC